MLYKEYLECAKKHINSCQQLLKGLQENADNKEAFMDIWYLAGYIIEGVTVYSAYKIHDWNPKVDCKDIQKSYDKRFSRDTKLDYYYRRVSKGEPVFDEGVIKCFVQGHNFQNIIEVVFANGPFKGVPIIGDGVIDDDVKILVDKWKPGIRYWYGTEQMKEENIPDLTVDLLNRLVKTCIDACQKMIYVIG